MLEIETDVKIVNRGDIVEDTPTVIQLCGHIIEPIAKKLRTAGYIPPNEIMGSDIPIGVTYHHGGWLKKTTHKNVPKELAFLRKLGIQLD